VHYPTLTDLPPPPPGRTGWPWTEASPQLPDAMPDGAPWPRVCVVTPSYNQGQFLEETIRSVLLQGYPNLEYIIIDGGSTDQSVGVIRKYESWLVYWVSETDEGQSDGINKGFARSSGELLGWLNSDDRLRPAGLQILGRFLQEQPDVGIVYGDCGLIDGQGRDVGMFPTADFDLRRHLIVNLIPQPAALFSRRVWELNGPLRMDLHYIMDYALWTTAALSCSVVHLPAVVADTRLHDLSKTVNQTIRFKYELEVFYREFFASSDVPADLKALEGEARGANFFGMGREHLRAREYREARRAFANAWRLYPLNLNKPMILPFWLDSILRTNFGSTLFRLAIWVKHGKWESRKR
jgi:glycosyltransferase involved in cell wall biosynthesis